MLSINLTPVTSISRFTGTGQVVAFNVGPDKTVYLVVALRPLDYRTDDGPNKPSFAIPVPEKPQSYRVVALRGPEPVLDVTIDRERFNIHHVQPLGDELLLACGRSRYRGPDDFDKNGRIYTRTGRFSRELLLGDGIETVQTTSRGVIWTSYFDEGVFGNGWREPIGSSGLVAWRPDGIKEYEFQTTAGLDPICDCYALNVESDTDTWLYYYTEFPLVRLHEYAIKDVWEMPTSGSHAFAVLDGHALFRGDYDSRDVYRLYKLDSGRAPQLISSMTLRGPNDRQLHAEYAVGRADTLHLVAGDELYRLDVKTAMEHA